ncbi:hypothetical protein EJ02DRAFT_231876 [Clathrospora elynae]|uniref:Uncharacterized protein n=1 Tax=Clathrospora elynae TaxID=706981 RepID=A0A6A5SLI4_9PLEO|nr:hypothetical protein EJ02DRAFT_231876 [Clathrospora elynae]
MRQMVLQDKKSVALPQSHIQGLIPYFRQLPKLRCIRRVDLWNTVFPSDYHNLAWDRGDLVRGRRLLESYTRTASNTFRSRKGTATLSLTPSNRSPQNHPWRVLCLSALS